MGPPQTSPAALRARVVALGASNLARGIAPVVRRARAAAGGPVQVLAAFGRGRSLGLTSGFLGHSLPPITSCGLWRELERGPELPGLAVLTDVGNDLMYGPGPQHVVAWIEECLDRLARAGIDPRRTVLTTLPLARLERLRPWALGLWRRLFFPASGPGPAEALDAARELDARVRERAARRGITLVELDPAWYGLDPIHFGPMRKGAAWDAILRPWLDGESGSASPRELLLGPRLNLMAPERDWILGRERFRAQPAVQLADGTTIACY